MKKSIFYFLIIVSVCIFMCACHKHESDGTLYFDDEYHYHECTSCGEAFDKEKHVFDEGIELVKASEYKEGKMLYTCIECGYEKEEIVEKLPHTHSLLTEYESDIEYHWKTCTKCFEVVGKEKHTFEEKETKDVDGIEVKVYRCKTCGKEKTVIVGLEEKENLLDYVSNVVQSDTVDILPQEINGKTYEWISSDNNLYQIEGIKGRVIMKNQTHQKQTVTITVVEHDGEREGTYTKEIEIAPITFKEMTNPKAIYYSQGAQSNYTNHSERYKREGTLFSEKFKNNMDMLYYAFAYPSSDGTVSFTGSSMSEVMNLRNYGIRVIIVIAGVSSSNLQALTICSDNDTLRQKLVNNILKMVKDYNFDGVDMDWEYPGTSGLDGYTTAKDKVNLNKLMRDLRNGLDNMQDSGGSPYILSAAIPATSWGSARYQFKKTSEIGGLNDYCDYINMMSYDSNNPDYCTHLAPLYSSAQSHDYKFGCVYGTNTFTSMGLDKKKIILGAACYGKAYKVGGTVSASSTYPALNNSGTLCQVEGLDGSFKSGTMYYSAITTLTKSSGWKKYIEKNNGNIVGAYLYNSSLNIYITYDSADTVKAKCEYAKANGMGVMAWAYGEDSTDTIVDTICDNL